MRAANRDPRELLAQLTDALEVAASPPEREALKAIDPAPPEGFPDPVSLALQITAQNQTATAQAFDMVHFLTSRLHPAPRLASFAFFTIGALLLAVVIIQNFIYVARLLF